MHKLPLHLLLVLVLDQGIENPNTESVHVVLLAVLNQTVLGSTIEQVLLERIVGLADQFGFVYGPQRLHLRLHVVLLIERKHPFVEEFASYLPLD